jgi:hypothetical protein
VFSLRLLYFTEAQVYFQCNRTIFCEDSSGKLVEYTLNSAVGQPYPGHETNFSEYRDICRILQARIYNSLRTGFLRFLVSLLFSLVDTGAASTMQYRRSFYTQLYCSIPRRGAGHRRSGRKSQAGRGRCVQEISFWIPH